MKVLVACEFSGIVRDAFAKKGHEAWSCDLLPTEKPGKHIQGDIIKVLSGKAAEYWDLIIAHPYCTDTAVSGARYFKEKIVDGRQQKAIDFFMFFIELPIQKIAVEHPISIMSTIYRKPDQIIQPWQFGHGETKATCLWLKGLPELIPTNIVEGREGKCWKQPPSPDRWKNRSRTYQGVADCMAATWG